MLLPDLEEVVIDQPNDLESVSNDLCVRKIALNDAAVSF
jgi:hypothetical protein